jgi:hypothetical protein
MLTAWGLHPIGAGVVEPGVEVKLPLLDRSGRRNTISDRVRPDVDLVSERPTAKKIVG